MKTFREREAAERSGKRVWRVVVVGEELEEVPNGYEGGSGLEN